VFFDLDHTLWDYDANATETLIDLLSRYEVLKNSKVMESEFIAEFFITNGAIWNRFDLGLVDRDYIRKRRFPILLEKLGIGDFDLVEEFQNDFMSECPKKGKLLPEAEDIVRELAEIYPLYLVTNGFDEIQEVKLECSGLSSYFTHLITSERAKFQKPDPGIFHYAMNLAGADVQNSIMIGDNLLTDIQGARSIGMDQVFFNPTSIISDHSPTYEINHLTQLRDILL